MCEPKCRIEGTVSNADVLASEEGAVADFVFEQSEVAIEALHTQSEGVLGLSHLFGKERVGVLYGQ